MNIIGRPEISISRPCVKYYPKSNFKALFQKLFNQMYAVEIRWVMS